MTSRAMHRVAARVAASPLGEDVLVYLDGVEHAVRATRMRDEKLVDAQGQRVIRRSNKIRIPSAALPEQPQTGDRVQTEEGLLYVVQSLEDGPSYVITLSKAVPR